MCVYMNIYINKKQPGSHKRKAPDPKVTDWSTHSTVQADWPFDLHGHPRTGRTFQCTTGSLAFKTSTVAGSLAAHFSALQAHWPSAGSLAAHSTECTTGSLAFRPPRSPAHWPHIPVYLY